MLLLLLHKLDKRLKERGGLKSYESTENKCSLLEDVKVIEFEMGSRYIKEIATDKDTDPSVLSKPSELASELTTFPGVGQENVASFPTSPLPTATTLTLTKDLAYCFEKGGPSLQKSRNAHLAITEDLAKMFETGKGIKAQLADKRRLFYSMDSFDIEDTCDMKEQRFITKNGFLHVHYAKMPGLNKKICKDMFHTIMDAKWRYFMLLFTLSFLISWLFFAAVWYLVVHVRRGINCVDNVDSFVSAFLFSLETQVTIGYGGRAVTDECPEGVIILIIQTIIGTFINCALLGLLFAKLARPKNRGKTIVFSKRAVISLRDGKYCLMYRYVDLRERKLLDSNMRLVIIKPRLTEEGEFVPLDMMDMGLDNWLSTNWIHPTFVSIIPNLCNSHNRRR